jgi:Protein of unknown function DUF262
LSEQAEGVVRHVSSEPEEPTPEWVEAAEAQIVEQSKRIEFYISEYSVELLAQKMRSGEYVIPDYQREFTWEPERKSKFIESLLMGLPIPFMFSGRCLTAGLKSSMDLNGFVR